MLLLLTAALAAQNPVRASHATVAWGAGLGVVSLGLLTAHGGPHLDAQDVLALRAGGILLGTLGGALVVGGEGRAGNALRDRGLHVPAGGWITSAVGVAVTGIGGGCVVATQKRVTTESGQYTEPAPVACSALYVTGAATTYTAGFVQALIDDAVTPDPPDDEGGEAEPPPPEPPEGLRIQVSPLWVRGGGGLLVGGTFR